MITTLQKKNGPTPPFQKSPTVKKVKEVDNSSPPVKFQRIGILSKNTHQSEELRMVDIQGTTGRNFEGQCNWVAHAPWVKKIQLCPNGVAHRNFVRQVCARCSSHGEMLPLVACVHLLFILLKHQLTNLHHIIACFHYSLVMGLILLLSFPCHNGAQLWDGTCAHTWKV